MDTIGLISQRIVKVETYCGQLPLAVGNPGLWLSDIGRLKHFGSHFGYKEKSLPQTWEFQIPTTEQAHH